MAGADSFIGRKIAGKYEILARLGVGGMGAVYRARHANTGGDVAVKVLHGTAAFDQGMIRRFQLEAQNAAALRHSNTIRINDFGVDDGVFYLVMEYLDGRSLAEVVRDDGPLPWRRAVHILRQVLKSLWEAHEHERRIVHRDIKPANIFLVDLPGEPDHVKVLDFGIARSLAGTGAGTQGFIGTPHYMAPEVWRGEQVDARTDLYAVGCVAFQLLVGKPPFVSPPSAVDSVLPMLEMHCHLAPPETALVAPAAPVAVCAWVDALLAKDRARRPPSARAALASLDAAVADLAAGDAPGRWPPEDDAVTLAPTHVGPDLVFTPAVGGPTPPERRRPDPTVADPSAVGGAGRRRWPRRATALAAIALVAAAGAALALYLHAASSPAGTPGARAQSESEALRYLPRSAAAVAVVASPQRLLDAVGYEEMAARLGAQLDPLVAATRAMIGADLFVRETYRRAGLALDAPAGAAVLDADRGVFAVFATVADRGKLDAALSRAITDSERHELLGATLLAPAESDYAAVVVRGDVAMVVVAADGGARNYARRLATLLPADALASDPAFADAVGELEAADDVVAWADLSGLARAAMPACDPGVPCAAERRLVDLILTPVGRIAFGATLRPRAIELSAFAPLPADAWLARALRNAPGLPAVIAATPRPPYLLASVQVDVHAALEVVDLALRAGGDSLDGARRAVRDATGGDLDGALATLTGELGGLIAFAPEQLVGTSDDEIVRQMGIALVAGVSREDGVRALLERLAHPGGLVRSAPGESGRFELWLPPEGPKLELRLASGFVVAASDPAFFDRVAARDPDRSFVAQVSHPDLEVLLSRPERAAVLLLPVQTLAPLALGYPSSCSGSGEDGWRSDDPDVAAKQGELAALVQEADRAYDEDVGQLARATADLRVRFGLSVATVQARERGLALSAGQYLGAPLTETLLALIDTMADQVRRREAGERRCARIWELDNAIQAARPPSPEAEPEPDADAP